MNRMNILDGNEHFERACVDRFPVLSVRFEYGVFVLLHDHEEYDDEAFMRQIDMDLLLYACPSSCFSSHAEAQKSLEQTAAWWCEVRRNRTPEDALIILRALYKLNSMPYPTPDHPMSRARVRGTFERRNTQTTPPSVGCVHAIVHTLGSIEDDVMVIVHAAPDANGEWPGGDRERVLGTLGADMIRHCKLQPRVVAIHNRNWKG